MFVAYVVLAVLLAVGLGFSARAFLVKDPKIVGGLPALGVSEGSLPLLAAAKAAGALGLLAGIVFRPLGIAAAVGLVLYFLGAVVAHLKAGDTKGAPGSVLFTLLSAAALALALAS
ncbi:DoxX family protein [Kitasatospora sp. NPDC051853]|uniref:DoxX family protein n=1 Tax=Kitasatospora sp. NPDC051853 TaxID=3364058 RepID=UPI0037926007